MRKSILFDQNFLRSRELVATIISRNKFNHSDIVYEIGPGKGIITRELASICAQVIAIEIDKDLFDKLKIEFREFPNIKLINLDFLKFELPNSEYKVFTNIPYNMTADIIKKLLSSKIPPLESYLIVQKEAAEKFAGKPSETQFSILNKPWFEFDIIWSFKKTDFYPIPKVDSVLLRINKRKESLLSKQDEILYEKFVKYGFGRWKANLKQSYKNIFTYEQWKKLSRNLKFDFNSQPTMLDFEQWLGLFYFFRDNVEKSKAKYIKSF